MGEGVGDLDLSSLCFLCSMLFVFLDSPFGFLYFLLKIF